MSKGAETYTAIVEHALNLSSELGLEGLTIGSLASQVGMSKSGLYAHFASKEALQCAVLQAAATRFSEQVLLPALAQPAGLARLNTLFEQWMRWGGLFSGGCLFAAGGFEYDDRPGPVRDALREQLGKMLASVARIADSAMACNALSAEHCSKQFAFEYWGIILTLHQHQRLFAAEDAQTLARTAFSALLKRFQATP